MEITYKCYKYPLPLTCPFQNYFLEILRFTQFVELCATAACFSPSTHYLRLF